MESTGIWGLGGLTSDARLQGVSGRPPKIVVAAGATLAEAVIWLALAAAAHKRSMFNGRFIHEKLH